MGLEAFVPEAKGVFNGRPDYGYGNRYGTQIPKGRGYFGEVTRPDGFRSTEISVGTDLGEIPSMVPTLSADELDWLMQSEPEAPRAFRAAEPMPEGILSKAYAHAALRRLQGLDPFATVNDEVYPLPQHDLITGAFRGTR